MDEGWTRWLLERYGFDFISLHPEDFHVPLRNKMAGMPERAAVFVDGSPVFTTLEGFKGKVLAKFSDAGNPLLSGYLIGAKYLHGRAAALDVEFDKGHIVLLGFRPKWRAQPFGTFRVVFNATLYGR